MPYSSGFGTSLNFSGFIQGQFQLNQASEPQLDAAGAPLNRDQFVLRAARLRVDGGYEYAAYSVELDANTVRGPKLGLRRAEASLLYRGERSEGPPLIALTAGVTDLPFGFELTESTSARWFTERSAVSEALFPTQTDIGAKLFGGYRFVRYAFGFFNGQPVNDSALTSDPNAAKDFVGHLGVDTPWGSDVALSFGTSFSFGRGFHRGETAVKDSVAWRDDNSDGVATPNEIVGVPGAAATPSRSFKRWALGADLQLQVQTPIGTSVLTGEGYVASNQDRGLFLSDPIVTGFDLRQVGWVASFTQGLTRYAIVGVRTSHYNPDSDFAESTRGNTVPRNQGVTVFSPLAGFTWEKRARLIFQYDFVRDHFARDSVGVPADAKNNQFTGRLQVNL